MSSTYSTNLKIELIGTGEQTGSWGTTTNTNLGTTLEEAIVGKGDVSFTNDANLTLTLSSSNTSQTARKYYLSVTSTVSLTAQRDLIVPTSEKTYAVYNGTTGSQAIRVKTSAGTGVVVPNGKRMVLYVDGTNVVEQIDYATSLEIGALTLSSALPVASGGTGASTASGARTNLGLGTIATQAANNVSITGGSISGVSVTLGTDLAIADGGTGASDATNARANLGAAASGANSDITSLDGLTTALSVAQGGTGVTTKTGTGPVVLSVSPYLTGEPHAPTATAGTNTTQIATTEFVQQAELVGKFGLFYKVDPETVLFTKTGNGTASIKACKIDVAGKTVEYTSVTAITMPALTAGTDYAIWVKDDATIQADASFTVAPGAGNWRKIGGFHYAPGGHSGSPGGGNTTPGIWDGSFWDLKFRPVCPDPRGMEYKFGSWMDMYLTNTNAITLGSSRYNVTIADGGSPPKVPTVFGGNGSTTYGSYTWFEAAELASSFGKRLPTQREFMAHAYGTTEASSIGTDQGSTIHNAANAAYMSAAGLFQATGVMWIWADDRAGPFAAASWNANTEGRGSEYSAPNAALLGGSWADGAVSGSRSSYWGYAASVSNTGIGSRFCCDHLQLD